MILKTLLRLLFPKWNLFDKDGYSIELRIRNSQNQDWRPMYQSLLPFQLSALFYNPEAQLRHAIQNALMDLAAQCQTGEPHIIDKLPSYRVIVDALKTTDDVQFQLLACWYEKGVKKTQEVLQSSIINSESRT